MTEVDGRAPTPNQHEQGGVASTPLKLVIVAPAPLIRKWEYEAVNDAVAAGAAQVSAIIYTGDTVRGTAFSSWAARMVERSSAALKPVDVSGLVNGAPCLDRCAEGEADRLLGDIRPDVILVLGAVDAGFARLCAGLARYGALSYGFGPAQSRAPCLAALLASQSCAPTLSVALTLTSTRDVTLNSGSLTTFPAKPARTVDQACFSVTPWLRRALVDLGANGLGETAEIDAEPAPRALSAPHLLAGVTAGFARAQAHYRLFRQQWNVGVVPAPIAIVAGLEGAAKQAQALAATTWMPEEKGRFFADPFGHETTPGEISILFELFDWPSDIGTIAARTFREGRFGPVQTILDTGTHLSYPFVATIDGARHYIPEHSAAQDVSAYPIDATSGAASRTPVMPEASLLDCTFVEWNGKVWMFATQDRHAKNSELFLFYADALPGPWTPHPLNPIRTDVGSARPGGTPFLHKGKLYRPSQDCSTHYGRATVINEIVALSETDYRECAASRVEPPAGSPYAFGLHTVSAVGDLTLIDGARKVGRWAV